MWSTSRAALWRGPSAAYRSLVLLGSGLGFFVHPYFIGLAAFIGAGLTFAGITDTCGMGMMLARMPWNQVAGKSPNKTAGQCATHP